MGERLTFTIPDSLDGERLDKAVSVLGEMSRAVARQIIDDKQAVLDGETPPARHRVSAGQVLSFPAPPEAEGIQPEEVDFAVVYEDDDVIVVDKPAGLVVHPGAGHDRGTLVAGLLQRHPEIADVGVPARPGIVHRLDRDTSGLLVAALSATGFEGLRRQVSERTMEREYLALVDGLFEVPTGTIDARSPATPTGPHAAASTRPGAPPAPTTGWSGRSRSRGCRSSPSAWRPAAPTRSGSTWRQSAIRWPVTGPTGPGPTG